MEDLGPWVLILVVLALMAAVLRPMYWQKPARKLDMPKPEEEYAEEMTLEIPVPQRKKIEGEDPYIPHCYGVDRLVLSVKDPQWLYAYWEISATKQEEFIQRYGQETWQTSRPAMRVYDITGMEKETYKDGHSFREFILDPWADNWFIEVGQPDRSFYAELGRMLADGIFIPLLRSNIVTTPRASVSDRLDEEWMWIEELYQAMGRKVTYGLSSAVLVEEHIIEGISETIPLGISSPGFEK